MSKKSLSLDFRISLLYLLFGGLWILLSDNLLAALISDPILMTRLQLFKGWAFVAVSALVIFLLLRNELRFHSLAENQLDEVHTRLVNIIETTPGIVCTFRLRSDGSACFPFGGERLAEAYGVTQGRLDEDAAPFFALVHPDDLAGLKESIADSARHLSAWRREWRVRHPIYGEMWIEAHSVPLREPDGSTVWHGVANDITERKRAEVELRLAEERFSNAFHTSPAGLTITRIADGKFIDANETFCKMFEFSRDEVIGHTSTDLNMWTPEERKKLIDEQIRSGGLENFELSARTKSGRVVNILFSSKPMDIGGETHHITTMIDITERKQAEEALSESEDKFRHVFETANVGKSITLPSGKISVNRAFADMLGYTREELADKTWQELTPSDEIEPIQEIVSSLLNGEAEAARFIKRYIHKNGSYVWADVSVAVRRDSDGKLRHFITTIVNINERMQAEEKLRENEERLRLATEQANIAVWEYDFNANSMSRSDNHDPLYGLERQHKWDINTFLNATHPEDREYSNRTIQTAVDPGGPDNYRFDFRVVFPDKTIRWLHVNGRVIERNEKGQGIIVRGTLADVTEQKQVELALRESEARYRNLLEVAPVGIAVHSGGRVVFTNPAGQRLLGAETEEQLIGKPILEIIHPSTSKAAQARIQRMLAGEQGLYPVEDIFLRLDGTPVNVEVMATALNYQGKPAVQVIVTDITERKRAQEELRLHRDRLADLSRRLVEAHENAQRAIGRELHDQIGQMLTALKLTIEIAPKLPSDLAAKKMSGAQELLDELMTRVSNLSLELRPSMLDDLGLIPALLWHVNRYKEQTGIEVDFKHSGVEGRRFDSELETTAYRIVQEALTNVARHARATHVRLEVRLEVHKIEIYIEDDGAGFDAEGALAKHRGLSAMQERAQLVGGEFDIKSGNDQGTRIRICLPLLEENS